MIVAVLEHCADDTDAMFVIDTDKLDESDPEQKQYKVAVLASAKSKRGNPADTGENVAFNYRSDEWKAARVKPPCHLDATAEIWEGMFDG